MFGWIVFRCVVVVLCCVVIVVVVVLYCVVLFLVVVGCDVVCGVAWCCVVLPCGAYRVLRLLCCGCGCVMLRLEVLCVGLCFGSCCVVLSCGVVLFKLLFFFVVCVLWLCCGCVVVVLWLCCSVVVCCVVLG